MRKAADFLFGREDYSASDGAIQEKCEGLSEKTAAETAFRSKVRGRGATSDGSRAALAHGFGSRAIVFVAS